MPITGPASYIPVTDEFLTHWQAANTALGLGNALVLSDGETRAILLAKKEQLSQARIVVSSRAADVELARGDLDDRKRFLLMRLGQFFGKVRAYHGGTKWHRALPDLPSQTDGQTIVDEALTHGVILWEKLNADPAIANDVVVLDGYTQVQFSLDVADLRTAYTTYNNTTKLLELAREDRNDIQDVIYPILKNYREALPTFFQKEHALVDTLPRLTPGPGKTPNPVTATATYDQVQHKAHVTWTESDANDLAEYRVAYTIGPVYSTDDEQFIGTILPGAPREFFTDTHLAANGNTISLKVYVITTTGHEKGSNAVTVTRVEAPPPTGP